MGTVAIFAALCNPSLELHRIDTLFSPTQVVTSGSPQRFEVVSSAGVFTYTQPSEATPTVDHRPCGDVVLTTGKAFGSWVEAVDGGWALTDGWEGVLGNGEVNLKLLPD